MSSSSLVGEDASVLYLLQQIVSLINNGTDTSNFSALKNRINILEGNAEGLSYSSASDTSTFSHNLFVNGTISNNNRISLDNGRIKTLTNEIDIGTITGDTAVINIGNSNSVINIAGFVNSTYLPVFINQFDTYVVHNLIDQF
jgi:hypothetical protein